MSDAQSAAVQQLARRLLSDGVCGSETDAVLAAIHVLANASRDRRAERTRLRLSTSPPCVEAPA